MSSTTLTQVFERVDEADTYRKWGDCTSMLHIILYRR
jgi:hypothetical protein